MIHHGNILACAPFGHADILADGLSTRERFDMRTFLARGLFDMWTFWHRKVSAKGYFGILDVPSHAHFDTGTFSCQHEDFSALGIFGMRNLGCSVTCSFNMGNLGHDEFLAQRIFCK